MARTGHSISNASGVFGYSTNTTIKKSTQSELEDYVDLKMSIIDDFCIGKHKLKAAEKKNIRESMLSLKSIVAIDNLFKQIVYERM